MSTDTVTSNFDPHVKLGELCTKLGTEDVELFHSLWTKYQHFEERHVWLLWDFPCQKLEQSRLPLPKRLARKASVKA